MLVTVPLAGGLSASDWARRHAAGEVPDRSPYGLHRLTDRGVDVRFASAGFGPGRSGRAAARLKAQGETGARTVLEVAPYLLSPTGLDELIRRDV